MNINKIYQYSYNRLMGFHREAAGRNIHGQTLYKWVKTNANVKNETIRIQSKLPSGTLVDAEYNITPQLNIGTLVRKEILKPDKTEIYGSGYLRAVSIKKDNTLRMIYLKTNKRPKLLRYLEENVQKSIINLNNFTSLLKLK